jgi:(p)ppGpp synthase/HD superfamily hydrolase
MKPGWSQELYIKAYKFAGEAHKKQKLPGSDLPYIMHLTLVSMEIMAALSVENNLDGDLAIQCALLHDTIEDTGIKYDNLKDEFGIMVANGVNALSKNGTIKSKKEQMTDSLERIKKQPKEVWMVKLADRITNLQPPPLNWDQEKISNYQQEAKLIYDNLKDASKFLADRLKKKIDNYNLEKPAIQYKVYIDDNFHYMDESERDFAGVFSSAKEAIAQAKQIVDRSLRWERLQATDPNNAEELYDRYKDFGDDPFIRSEDPNCKFSAWTYAKEKCRDIVNEDIKDKKLYNF